MSTFSELLVGSLSGLLESVGESKLVDILQELYAKDAEEYKAAIFAGNVLVTKLSPLVGKSGTKIDDAILKAIGDAITTSAAKNGVQL